MPCLLRSICFYLQSTSVQWQCNLMTHGTVHAFESKELERFILGIVPLPHAQPPLTLAVSTRNSFRAVWAQFTEIEILDPSNSHLYQMLKLVTSNNLSWHVGMLRKEWGLSRTLWATLMLNFFLRALFCPVKAMKRPASSSLGFCCWNPTSSVRGEGSCGQKAELWSLPSGLTLSRQPSEGDV